ncbi:erg26, C-3 sterol dehydrogenase [Loxospora ochrophaea]|nr:erg26, C-3 sterol dehydrogenase [Loxospora ochrophaea]
MASEASEESSKSPKSLGSVLVVGGCGFVGHHIVQQLLESYSAQVSVLDLRTNRNRFSSVTYYDGDITSSSDVESVLQKAKPAVIIHTASPAFIADVRASSAVFQKVNVEGTRNLVECAGKAGGVKAFIYTSSASIVQDSTTDLINADERWPALRAPIQKDYYAETKAIAEGIVLAANRQRGSMLTTAIRPAGIFGEGDVQLMPPMIREYHKGTTKFQVGDNNNLFDYTYVGNVAHAHILAAIALLNTHALAPTIPLDHERVDGETFNITNDEPLYFWDFPRMMWYYMGDNSGVDSVWVLRRDLGLAIASVFEWIFWLMFWVKAKPTLTRRVIYLASMTRYFSVEKARRRLGYRPVVGMEEAVRRSMKAFGYERGELGEIMKPEEKKVQ